MNFIISLKSDRKLQPATTLVATEVAELGFVTGENAWNSTLR